jgi:hypothetical protein
MTYRSFRGANRRRCNAFLCGSHDAEAGGAKAESVASGFAADPLNLIQVMLAEGTSASPVARIGSRNSLSSDVMIAKTMFPNRTAARRSPTPPACKSPAAFTPDLAVPSAKSGLPHPTALAKRKKTRQSGAMTPAALGGTRPIRAPSSRGFPPCAGTGFWRGETSRPSSRLTVPSPGGATLQSLPRSAGSPCGPRPAGW